MSPDTKDTENTLSDNNSDIEKNEEITDFREVSVDKDDDFKSETSQSVKPEVVSVNDVITNQPDQESFVKTIYDFK